MELYDKLIAEIFSSLPDRAEYTYSPSEVCALTDSGTLVLSKDSAFEYGGGALPAINSTLFSTDDDISDRVIVCGKDIHDALRDTPYARIAIIRLKKDAVSDDDALYKQLKNIELSKYHVYPAGCLIRLSPKSKREQLRVGKKAVADGLSLKNIGFAFISEYKKNPLVAAVTVLFVTDPGYDYKILSAAAEKANAVTESLNKIMEGLEISCDTCELKTICDEVEGLRQLHFGKER